MAEMNMGDAMKVAVVIQDLTRSGMARLAHSLRQIPSELNINVRDNFKELKGIQNLKHDINDAGARVLKLNEYLSGKLGENFLKGLIADAQRSEKNLKKVEDALMRMNRAMDKNEHRSFMRSFANMNIPAKKAALNFVNNRLGEVGGLITTGEARLSSYKSHETDKINKEKAALANLRAEYNGLSKARSSMERQIDRAERKRIYQQERESKRQAREIKQGENTKANITHRGGKTNLGIENKDRFERYKALGKAQRDVERGAVIQGVNDAKRLYNDALAKTSSINPKDKTALQEHQRNVDALKAKWEGLHSLRQKMAGYEGSVVKKQRAEQERESKRQVKEVAKNTRLVDRLKHSVQNLFNKRGFKQLEQRFRNMTPEAQHRAMSMINARMARVTQNIANARANLEGTPKSHTASIRQQADNIRRLEAEYRNLSATQTRMRGIMGVQEIRREVQARRENNQAVREYRQQMNSVQVAMQNTSNFASQLKEDLTNAFGYYALKQFLANLVEIGGQFEYQRRAIANILQDETKANRLFEQIKELGLRSPFSTLELDQFTKQLSAFNIPYNQMFDKLKKIADIAAGTGADMSRIILAYGHVKAEGFLTGIQRRQFSNANINIVGGLADYYSKQEGRRITTRDVYKRIHDKQVTFEDMDTVLMSLAEPGGQFFNMQEVMADTVKGTYKNLSDAMNHAYAAIEKSSGGVLGFVGKQLTNLLKMVESFPGAASRFITIMTMMAGLRALNAKVTNKEVIASVKKMKSLDQESIAMGRNNSAMMKSKKLGGKLFGGTALTEQTLRKHAKYMKQNAGAKDITLRAIAQRQLNKESAEYLKKIGAISQKEYDRAIAQRSFFGTVSRGIKGIGVALKGLWSTMWPMLAITGIIEGVMFAYNKLNDTEGKARRDGMLKSVIDTYGTLSRTIEEIKDSDFGAMDRATIWDSIVDMSNAVKDNLANSDQILARIFQRDANGEFIKNSVQQAEELKKELIEAELVLQRLKNDGSVTLYDAPDAKGKWKDARDASLNLDRKINKFLQGPNNSKYLPILAANIAKDKDMAEYMKGFDYDKNPSLYLRRFFERAQKQGALDVNDPMGDFFLQGEKGNMSSFKDMFKGILDAAFDWQEAHMDARSYATQLASQWQNTSKNRGIVDPKQQHTIAMAVLSTLGLDEQGQKIFAEWITRDRWKQFYTPGKGEVKQDLTNIAKRVRDAQDTRAGESYIPKADATINELIEGVVELFRKANEKVERLSKTDIVKGFGVDAKSPKKVDLKVIGQDNVTQEYGIDWNKAVAGLENAKNAAAVLGITLEILKKMAKDGGGSNEDAWLKKMRERIEKIRKAAQSYDEWRKVFGKDMARDRISKSDEFKDLFSDWTKVNLGDLNTLLKDELKKSGWDANENRKRFKHQVGADVLNLDLKDAKDGVDRAIKQLDEYMKKRKEAFDIYTKMFEATGSFEAASFFAFGLDNKDRIDFADTIKATFNDGVSKYLKGTNLKTFTYEEALGFKEEDWKTYGESIRKTFEDAKDAIEQWEKVNKEKYIDFLKEDKSYKKALAQIESTKANDLYLLSQNEGTVDDTARVNARSDLAKQELYLSESGLLDNIASFDFSQAKIQLEAYQTSLNNAYKTGAISAEDYRNKIDKVSKAMDAIRKVDALGLKSSTYALLSGGLPGYYEQVRKDYEVSKTDPKMSDEEKKRREKEFDKVFGEGGLKETTDTLEGFNLVLGVTRGVLDGINGAFLALKDMFEALGKESQAFKMERASDSIGVFTSILSPVSDALGSLFKGDLGGVASNLIQLPIKIFTGPVAAIARMHDKKLNRSIELSKQRLKDLTSSYKALGIEISRSIDYDNEDYTEQYENLIGQQKEVQRQLDLEQRKKNSNQDAIRDYNDQLSELKDKVTHYWADIMKELYGIDFRDYSARLSSALTDAFKNGQDAAIAWKRTVGDIVRDIANEAIRNNIVAPLFEELYDSYFGENGKFRDTVMTDNDIEQLGDDLLKMMGSSDFANAESFYRMLQEKFPYSNDDESVGGLSKIGQNITEETGGIIASYMNAIRADVSYNRKNLQQVVDKAIPTLSSMNTIAQSQLTELKAITKNTSISAESASAILGILQSASNGVKPLHIK